MDKSWLVYSLCLCHISICVIVLYSRSLLTKSGKLGHNQDIGAIPGLSRPFRDDWQLCIFTLRWCRVALWWRSIVSSHPLLLMGGRLVANVAGQCLLRLSLLRAHTVRHLSEVPQRLLTIFAVHQLKRLKRQAAKNINFVEGGRICQEGNNHIGCILFSDPLQIKDE